MNPDSPNQQYLVNQYHRQRMMEAAQRQRLVASLPRRAGRVDALMAHLGRSMVALGQWMQRRNARQIDEASVTFKLPAFDNG